MKKVKLALLLLLITVAQVVVSQTVPDWSKFQHLVGHWVGEGNGQPGQGTGGFFFQTDLDGNILVRKCHTEFPSTTARPAFTHDDLMVIYPDYTGVPSKAIYWDNERHTIEYAVSFTEKAVVFTSAASQQMPRFRLSYETIDASTVNVKFEMANPGSPDEFKMYLEGKSKKQK
ncbi:MAG: hypothetical protein NTV01_11705 [Bacteroidia bacterium]|nr:hypothetical protein [Bacteroidia bacterium]